MSLLVVNKVGKVYRAFSSEWLRVLSWFGLKIKPSREHWVIKNINFTVKEGEAIGIIGQNGAGKSTLLKLITKTMQPSEGDIKCSGRIAAILELGMGFDPELTGRQNVFHTAGLMGFNAEQVAKKISAIEDFSEIGKYFDEPVRKYSSGMQMRVAFSVATAFRPDILIVDEALSVGDSYFQHKSFDRIREFQKQGTTLLIVSHDRSAIQSLCTRAILLEKGEIIKDGNPEEIMDFYNALIAEKGASTVEFQKLTNGKLQTTSGSGEARVSKIELYDSKENIVEVIQVGDLVKIKVWLKVYSDIDSLVFGFAIKDRLGQTIFGTNTWHTQQVITTPSVNDEYLLEITFRANLGVGSYSIVTALHQKDTHLTSNFEWKDLALIFEVVNVGVIEFSGTNWLEPHILLESL
jgi:lipopolysaccharide transport system ATP-binding protein